MVELQSVPLENGTTGLHMLRTPSDHEGARVLDAFLRDPTVDPALRARFEEEIMNGTIPTTETEHMTVAERVRAEGFAEGERRGLRRGLEQGVKQGIERGIEQGRCTLIASVRARLGDEAAKALEGICDFDAFCVRAVEMLAEHR